jgi:hypothetical protein
MEKLLTNHKPPNSSLLALGQIRMRLIDDHDSAEHDCSADCSEDAQENGDGPLICEVVCDFDLEGIVMVVCDHEWRGGRVEGEVED